MSKQFVFKVSAVMPNYGCTLSTNVILDDESLIEMANDNFPHIPILNDRKSIEWIVELVE